MYNKSGLPTDSSRVRRRVVACVDEAGRRVATPGTRPLGRTTRKVEDAYEYDNTTMCNPRSERLRVHRRRDDVAIASKGTDRLWTIGPRAGAALDRGM